MDINWQEVIQFLGGTAILVSIAAYLARSIVKQLLEKDLVRFKTDLDHRAERELAKVKSDLEKDVLKEKHKTDMTLEQQKVMLQREVSRDDRIRSEILKWANPILGAVRGLRSRLSNILEDDGYLALQSKPQRPIPTGWSIDYEYFMPSTMYLFCQYFCWVRLLQEELSFEPFESRTQKDDFGEALWKVSEALGKWPFECEGEDIQVFNLQQRALGEALIVTRGAQRVCMGYHEFQQKYDKEPLAGVLKPLRGLLDGLSDDGACRWLRLEATQIALVNLENHCTSILQRDPG